MRFGPAVWVFVVLGACSDPLAGVGRLSDADVVEADPAAAAVASADEIARDGFFGTQAAAPEAAAIAAVDTATANTAAVAEPAAAGGFFRGLVRRAAQADPAAAVAADVAQSQSAGQVIETTQGTPSAAGSADAPVELAALPQETESRGLFGASPRRDVPRGGPDARDVPFGTVLAFGEIARVCDAQGKSLGSKIEGQGRRGFSLYDSNPGTKDRRTYYITGFGDDCPRQFTAANALFGTPSFYELIRFSPAGKHLPQAETDRAYDKVKSSVCRVGKDKPCGPQIDKMDAGTAFISAYEFGEHNGEWKEFLVHDGTVIASAVKSAQ